MAVGVCALCDEVDELVFDENVGEKICPLCIEEEENKRAQDEMDQEDALKALAFEED